MDPTDAQFGLTQVLDPEPLPGARPRPDPGQPDAIRTDPDPTRARAGGPLRSDGVPRVIEDDSGRPPAGPHRAALGPGVRLGRYRIEQKLGSGGMGQVFAAEDLGTGAPVALKLLLHREGAGPLDGQVGKERLLREATALSRVQHPNVLRLHRWMRHPVHGPVLVLERLRGVSLVRWLKAGPRPWHEVLDVLVQVGRGLSASHRASVIHRDLKPGNVHVDLGGRGVLLDFGLAISKTSPRAPTDDLLGRRLTDVGVILGTNGYIAPEQLLHETATPRSDQFSFAVMLYEALYGERPYGGETSLQYARLVRAGVRRPVPDRGVPRALGRILDRALLPDPDQRWPDMDAMLAAVDVTRRQLDGSWSRLRARATQRLRSFLEWRSPQPVSSPVPVSTPMAGTTRPQDLLPPQPKASAASGLQA